VAAGRPRSDSERTREHLLDAAQRLFAAHGIQGVSLRMVNAAAGAKNVSAAHYHFDSKEGLIRALVARCMETVTRERIAGLEAVERAAGSAPPDLRALVEAMVLPILRRASRDYDAGVVLARVSQEPGIILDQLAPPAFWAMVQRFATVLRRALPHLSDRALLVRLRFLFQQTFVAMADFRRRSASRASAIERAALERTVSELIDYLVGGLRAPSRADSAASPELEPPRSRGGHDEIARHDGSARHTRRRSRARDVSVG
jgi:AcrR family transcriptional regulator